MPFALKNLIGRSAVIEGKNLEVVEVLQDGPQIILKQTDVKTEILDNQYGEANSMTYRTWSIPLRSSIDNDLHPIIKDLLTEEEAAGLLEVLREED